MDDKQKKLRVSWTILSTWSKGDRDTAVKMIAGLPTPTNEYMERGKRIHNVISENKIKLIDEISDEAIFEDFRPDEKVWTNYFKVPITEWLDLSLVIDVLDPSNHLIIDWKASSRRSSEHNKMQIYMYALAMHLEGHDIDYGIFATVDEAKSDGGIFCREYTKFKINDEKLELAHNYIETVGSDIYSFLHMNDDE